MLARRMSASVQQLVGRTLGQRYRLERILGMGGMGAVFEATQLDLGRSVAVKVLLDVDPHGIARLRQEALTAGSLRCPHVVTIFDFQAPAGEPPFIVMELLPGRSLAQLLRQERSLAVPRATRIASQMLIGLEAAHQAGVIHRDVKPSNTWLVFGAGLDEHVKVLDFGIAKMLGDGSALVTTTGSVLGTPAYLAPEQLRGNPVDARADIHALGVVLFEMLSGARPWQATGPAIYAEILERQPPLLHAIAPHVPPALAQIVARALAKDPAARFQRASDLRDALEPFAGSSASAPATVAAGSAPAPSTVGAWPSSNVVALPPTVDFAPMSGAYAPPSIHATMPHSNAATFNDTRMSASPPAGVPLQGPHAPTARRSSGFALAFLLGGGVVVLGGGAIAAAFLIGRDGAGTAGTAVASGATGAAPGAAVDGGARFVSPPATAAKGAAAAAPRAGSPAAVAGRATSAKCQCLNRLGGMICTVPPIPNCGCTPSAGNISSLCPSPAINPSDGTCPVKGPNGLRPYSAVGRRNGQSCTGFFLSDDKPVSGTGATDCQFCYGRDTLPAVDGTACKGIGPFDGPDGVSEGKWACDH